ncbi:TetR/AcrR family transcriptional regulator [Marinicella gelatinilytica]|uniref:TetR/AcrR family transcriptional regulator n=1 Tax=Marinicella gelatinilytica TaxID=2996017 RepID=UPI002260E784|nr:TetR/AcrR family transcriptional regulator [Marinicella gelatinilytica]MCX7544821.1 TetR/AcrR family transcriptional regulator [Marinicella gelatinilytica]
MDYTAFQARFKEYFGDEWQFIYQQNKNRLALKNERIATRKLATIIPAVFSISKSQGFQGMTVRDLCQATGFSMGGLYKYFAHKDDLIVMIHQALVDMTEQILLSVEDDNPLTSIDNMLIYHLYISERLKRWFYFVFMEAKHLDKSLLNQFVQSENLMEQALMTHIVKACELNLCQCESPFLTATVFKSALQEWYLKTYKYHAYKISLEDFKQHLLNLRRQLLPTLKP